MKNQAIVTAAGSGTRLKNVSSKPLIVLEGKPLLIYCLEAFNQHSLIDSIVVTAHPKDLSEFERVIKEYKINKVKKVVLGGETRCVSVRSALKEIDEDTQCVLIHDGARPFIEPDIIGKAITLAQKEKAAVVAVPVKPTIKEVDLKNMAIKKTLKREKLWEVQTPQVFQRDVICQAHEQNNDIGVSDDAVLVERLGIKVKVVQGSYQNIKITTQDDLDLAKVILAKRKSLSLS